MNIFNKMGIMLFTLFGLSCQIASSQEMQKRSMTIQELAKNVQDNNIQLKLATISVAVAETKIGSVKTNRLPDISADLNAFYLSDVHIYDTSFKKLQTVNLPNFGNQFNLNANQLIFAGGKINSYYKQNFSAY